MAVRSQGSIGRKHGRSLSQCVRGSFPVLETVERRCKVVLGCKGVGIDCRGLAVACRRLMEFAPAILPVALADQMLLVLCSGWQADTQSKQQCQNIEIQSFQINFLLIFLSPSSISTTKSSRAIAKKYIYCSSYSSNTMLLNRSSSSLRMSSSMGLRPNSSLPAWT